MTGGGGLFRRLAVLLLTSTRFRRIVWGLLLHGINDLLGPPVHLMIN